MNTNKKDALSVLLAKPIRERTNTAERTRYAGSIHEVFSLDTAVTVLCQNAEVRS